MAKIKLNNGDAMDFQVSTDLIATDPPFDLCSEKLNEILSNINCDHLLILTTMKQLLGLMKISDWVLSFDFVLDSVVPKKSLSIHQPNYTHVTGCYLTRNHSRSKFDRKKRQRSDSFDNNGYWASVIKAPRERLGEHGLSKNENALTDIIGSFHVNSVYDPFAGSGTIGMAAMELGIDCELTELDQVYFSMLEKKFKFISS